MVIFSWYQSFNILFQQNFFHTIMSGGDKNRFVIEPHSRYYLHPSEGPGVLITAVVFDGKNYDLWERAVRTALKAKK